MSEVLKSQNSSATIPPKELAKIEKGDSVLLSKKQVYDYNYPNYSAEDIIVEKMKFEISEYDHSFKGNRVQVEGACVFDKNSNIPELKWEHVSSTIFILAINQGGKAAQNYTSTVNGIALRKLSCNIRKPAPLKDITFKFDSKIYVKMKSLWVHSYWDFFHKDKKIADFDVLSLGIQRDYTGVIARKKEHN